MRFTFRLALALGCTRRELFDRIDSRELTAWQAFYEYSPWGDDRADLRQDITSMLIAASNSSADSDVPKVTDFMPYDRSDEKKQTVKEQLAVARLIAQTHKQDEG